MKQAAAFLFCAFSLAGSQVPDSALVGNVLGRVVDASNGKPVGGAVVRLGGGRSARADAAGRFLINNVPTPYPSRRYTITATAPGYRSQSLDAVPVLPGAVMALECEFRLEGGGSSLVRRFDARPIFRYSHEILLRVPRWPGSKDRDTGGAGLRIFATREGLVGRTTANGHVIRDRDRFVALPSRRSLARKGTREYQVRLSANGRSAVAPVWDVGPWNIRDDYWSTRREQWRDVGRGTPESQAAYLDGYNGGKDGFGRKVTNPAGIDLADGTFWDDLGLRDNGWVRVEYLWDDADVPSSPEPERAPTSRRRPPSGRPSLGDVLAAAELIIGATRR